MKKITKIFLGIACACIGIGIVLAMLGFFLGARSFPHGNNTHDYAYKVNNISSIHLDVKYGYVKVVEGDEFTADVQNVVENGFKGYVQDGTWYLEQNGKVSDTVNIWGLELPFSFGWFNHDSNDYPTITVTIPNDFKAENFKIELGAGEIDVDQLIAQEADIEVGAGSMKVKHVNVDNQIKCEVGAGELVMKDLQTKDADFNCGVGNIRVTGEILENLKADCSMGRMKLDLNGNENNYSYYVDCGLGNVNVNDHNYSVSSKNKIKNENSVGTYDLSCGVGSLELTIK